MGYSSTLSRTDTAGTAPLLRSTGRVQGANMELGRPGSTAAPCGTAPRSACSLLPRLPPPMRHSMGGQLRRRQRRPAAPPQAALLPAKLLGTAAKAAAAVPGVMQVAAGSLAAAIDPGVLGATIAASGKLLLICAAVGWLLRSGRIPNSTATVMSQVGVGGVECLEAAGQRGSGCGGGSKRQRQSRSWGLDQGWHERAPGAWPWPACC